MFTRVLDYEITKIVDFLIRHKDVDLIMEVMIRRYSEGSIENCRKLLSQISKISDSMLSACDKKLRDANSAAFSLMCQREMDPKEAHTYFAMMVPVCKQMFPNGYPYSGNVAEKNFFELFLRLFVNRDGYDWGSHECYEWAENRGYVEYFNFIIDTYFNAQRTEQRKIDIDKVINDIREGKYKDASTQSI